MGALGSITVYLPANPVGPGDTWTQKVNVPQMQEMATVTGVFEKPSQVGRYKTAHIKLTVIVPVNSNVDLAAATQGKAKGTSSISGTVTMRYTDDFAIAEGRLIKSIGSGSTDLTVKQSGVTYPGAAAPAKPTNAHIKASISMTSTLVQ